MRDRYYNPQLKYRAIESQIHSEIYLKIIETTHEKHWLEFRIN